MIASLDKLRNLHSDGFDLDELLALSAVADGMEAQYDYFRLPHPDWFKAAKDELEVEIKRRIRDSLQKRKAAVITNLEALKTPTERKNQLRKELEELEEQLAG